MQFHGIKARLLGPQGSSSKIFHHLCNVGMVHDTNANWMWADANEGFEFFLRDGRHHVVFDHLGNGRHPQLTTLSAVQRRCFATVLQLHGNFGTVFVNPGGHLGQTRNEVVPRHTHLVRLAGAMRKRHRANPHGEQTCAPLGPLFIVGLYALAAGAIGFRKVGAHGGHDDSVADFQLTNAARLKQRLIRIAHGTPNTKGLLF